MDLATVINQLPGLRETVELHGLMAKKSLGQNFLLDRNITDKIIRLSLENQGRKDYSGTHVLEVGPGPGGLTRAVLAQNPDSLTVIEMDDRCLKIMQELQNLSPGKFNIINGDALKADFCALAPAPRHIVSNLPYNISVPLLVGWLKHIRAYQSLTLMFQKEVADRITANPGSKDYGRISVIAQLACQITRLFDLNPQCFVPAPKIWSTVLLFQPLANTPLPEEFAKIEKITSLAFGQRRKMIRQSLKSLPDLENKAAQAGISLTSRAEEITPQHYLNLARIL